VPVTPALSVHDAARQVGARLPITCPWRIRKSSQKRSGAGSLVRCRQRATAHVDDSAAHTRRPPAGHHCQTRTPGRSTCCRGALSTRIRPVLISSRARRRAPNLNSFDRFVLGLGSLFVPASRIPKLAVILKPRTLLRFHEALKKRKYRCHPPQAITLSPSPSSGACIIAMSVAPVRWARRPPPACPQQFVLNSFLSKDKVAALLPSGAIGGCRDRRPLNAVIALSPSAC
jgi:hypothetical protein